MVMILAVSFSGFILRFLIMYDVRDEKWSLI